MRGADCVEQIGELLRQLQCVNGHRMSLEQSLRVADFMRSMPNPRELTIAEAIEAIQKATGVEVNRHNVLTVGNHVGVKFKDQSRTERPPRMREAEAVLAKSLRLLAETLGYEFPPELDEQLQQIVARKSLEKETAE